MSEIETVHLKTTPFISNYIQANKLKFTVDGREYHWIGGFGAIFQSHERGRKPGDVRIIGGITFHVFQVYKRGMFQSPAVSWTVPNDDLQVEWIRSLRKSIFL